MTTQRDLSTFKRAIDGMVRKNQSQNNQLGDTTIKNYSLKSITKIIDSGSIQEKRDLSNYFYLSDGFYKKMVLYYATLLKYIGIMIPNPSNSDISDKSAAKKYDNALTFLNKMHVPELLTDISTKVLINGCYYGLVQSLSKDHLTLINLPVNYCRSLYKDMYGNDLIEFNVTFFDTFTNSQVRQEVLKTYPKEIIKGYTKYSTSKGDKWVLIPVDKGIFFSIDETMTPLFISVIPAIAQYDAAIETEQNRARNEIKKIIVQKIPHLGDGTLLFEPTEAETMHAGLVDMLRGENNVSVLTSYNDVECFSSKTSNENATATIDKMLQSIYSTAGVSMQLFSPVGTQALETSTKNDLSLMMILGNKYSHFITNIINSLFGNNALNFEYSLLPITYYNQDKFIDSSFKLAQSGYSFLLPALGLGIKQRDFCNLKDLENKLLKLQDKLIPLSSAYTHSKEDDKPGAPTKEVEDKAPRTIEREESLDREGGSK